MFDKLFGMIEKITERIILMEHNENMTSDGDHGNENGHAKMELDMKEIKWKWTWKFKEKIDTI